MRPVIPICIALIIVTLAVYWQVGNHGFLDYDDEICIVENAHVSQGLSSANIIWAFTSVEEFNWFPLTRLSHMVDVQLFGMNPRGHHLMNVAIHCFSTLLLFFLLLRLTEGLWQSTFVAAMFALHPMHVESVAWAAERKDVLSACFWFLTLLLYSRYAEAQRSAAKSGGAIYILTLCSFVLGLMSKPMLVTLPIVMLLLDFWPLHRFGINDRSKSSLFFLVKEKVPFFACSMLSSAITIYAQSKGGALVSLETVPFVIRFQNALVSYLKYIIKTFWPHDLAVLYPLSHSIPLWQIISSAVVLLLISVATICAGRRYPFLMVGWFWFLVTLLPVIGLIQVGAQSMADRYTYIPHIGLFIMIAWGTPVLFRSEHAANATPHNAREPVTYREVILGLLASLVIIMAASVSWQQLGYWKNSISLYRHTLNVTTGNSIINRNLGIALVKTGNFDAALIEFKTAVMIDPNDYKLRNILASALADKGDIDEAITEFKKILSINPNDARAKMSLEFWITQKEKRK